MKPSGKLPGIETLELAGFLKPLPPKGRFQRLRRGEWEVVFVRAPKAQKPWQAIAQLSDRERRLIERGVTATSAVRLVRENRPWQTITAE